eukprot:12403154-Karenia_brevis.AAC.1
MKQGRAFCTWQGISRDDASAFVSLVSAFLQRVHYLLCSVNFEDFADVVDFMIEKLEFWKIKLPDYYFDAEPEHSRSMTINEEQNWLVSTRCPSTLPRGDDRFNTAVRKRSISCDGWCNYSYRQQPTVNNGYGFD